MLTIYGVTVLTFMMVMYALEGRGRWFVLAFAVVLCAVEQLRVRQRRLALRRDRGDLVCHRPSPLLPPVPHAAHPARGCLMMHHDGAARFRDRCGGRQTAVTSGATTRTTETQRLEPNLTRSPSRTDTTQAANLPETFSYRVKRLLLGPPLVSEQLGGQRLGKPTALAVLSSDVMSSSAYATEQMLRTLILVGGLAAFSLITPLTAAILGVLAVVTICYRDVVRSYPKAGGSYVVSRDNFGPNVAQIAGAALLISYTITVAVSVAAGADAIGSAAPALRHAAVPLSITFVVLLAFGNLRGIREAGQVFAIPTYFFIANMAVLIVVGLVRAVTGSLGHVPRAAGTAAARPRRRRSAARHLGLLHAPGLRQRELGHDRHRGHLQRREHLQRATGQERPHHVGPHEHHPGRHVPGCVGAGRAQPPGAVHPGGPDGPVGDRSARVRVGPRRPGPLLRAAGRHGA